MTREQMFTFRLHVSDQHRARQRRVLASAFPETGGSEHLTHNWYACQGLPAERACADALLSSFWPRWDRIDAVLTRWARQIESRRTGRS